jgi:hypothetical protein
MNRTGQCCHSTLSPICSNDANLDAKGREKW